MSSIQRTYNEYFVDFFFTIFILSSSLYLDLQDNVQGQLPVEKLEQSWAELIRDPESRLTCVAEHLHLHKQNVNSTINKHLMASVSDLRYAVQASRTRLLIC